MYIWIAIVLSWSSCINIYISCNNNIHLGHVTSCHAGSSMADDIIEAKEIESNRELEKLSTIDVNIDNGISRI